MVAKINDYDLVPREHWSDRHTQMVEERAELEAAERCASGLKLCAGRTMPRQRPYGRSPGWGALTTYAAATKSLLLT